MPTTLEAGFANSDYNYWMGLFVPAKTPPAIIETAALRDREGAGTARRCGTSSSRRASSRCQLSPSEFDALVKREIDINIALVKAAGLKFN